MTPQRSRAVVSLIGGATLWGLIWYPYRLLEQAGVGGALATVATYGVTLVVGSIVLGRAWREVACAPWLLAGIALSAGWSIVSYVVGIIEGEVMRVLLLFYLAPLWTVPLARWFLNERPSPAGYAVLALAMAGAVVMLWRPELGAPWPASRAEWLGVSAGVAFSLSNIFVRKATDCGVLVKSLAVWIGSVVMGAAMLATSSHELGGALESIPAQGLLIVMVGLLTLAMSLLIQYGLTHLPANQALIIMLFELVVAAVSAYVLAGERMQPREWIGGAMIVAAGLFSEHLAGKPAANR